jgi:hypothetical protein
MSLGLYEGRNRRRRQFWWSVAKWALAIALILAAGAYSYYAGGDLAAREVVRLEAEIEILKSEIAAFPEERAELQDQIRTAVTRAKEWENQYNRDVPTGEMRAFLKLVEEKLASGDVSTERLAFLIKSASEPDNCVAEPQTKRFIVRTKHQESANDAVSFDSNRLTVTAIGEAAVNENGQAEGWFDPAKPLKVTLTRIGGKSVETTGLLPVHHTMVAGDKEYRLTLQAGPRGFVMVTGAVCAFPGG